MKKVLAFALLLGAANLQGVGEPRFVSSTAGGQIMSEDTPVCVQKNILPEEIAKVIVEFSDKNVSVPGRIIDMFNKLHAEKLSAAEKMFNELARNVAIDGTSVGLLYNKASQQAGDLAETLVKLSKIKSSAIKITMSDIHDMFALKAASYRLMASKLNSLSHETDDQEVSNILMKMAKHKLEMSQDIDSAIALAYAHPTPGEKKGFNLHFSFGARPDITESTSHEESPQMTGSISHEGSPFMPGSTSHEGSSSMTGRTGYESREAS